PVSADDRWEVDDDGDLVYGTTVLPAKGRHAANFAPALPVDAHAALVEFVQGTNAELERLRAELARVRPVVDAAVAWAEVWAAGSVADDERRALLLAVGRLWNETQGTGQ